MINFEEELKKFHPSLEIDEAEDVIINHNMTDFTDILVDMVKEQEKDMTDAGGMIELRWIVMECYYCGADLR